MTTEPKYALVHPIMRGDHEKNAILTAFTIWPENAISQPAINALRAFYELNYGPRLCGFAFRIPGESSPFLTHIF